jgi:hypothetical protein
MILVGIGGKTDRAQTIAASLSSSLLEADTFLTAVVEPVLFLRGSKTRPGWPMLRNITPRMIILRCCQKFAIFREPEEVGNLHALQTNESTLVVECRSTVPRAQLVDAEDTSDEDNDDCQTEERHEPLEPAVDTSAGDFAGSDVSAVAEGVLD